MKTKLLLGIALIFIVSSAQGEFRGMDQSYDCNDTVGFVVHCDDFIEDNPWSKLDIINIPNDRQVEAQKQSRWKMSIQHGGYGQPTGLR